VKTGKNHCATSWVCFGLRPAAISTDGKLVAFTDGEENVWLWNVESDKPLHRLTALPDRLPAGGNDPVMCVSFSSNNKSVAAGTRNGVVRVWRVDTAQEVAHYKDGRGGVGTVALSADGEIVLWTQADGMTRAQRLSTGVELEKLRKKRGNVRHLAISQDASKAAFRTLSDQLSVCSLGTGNDLFSSQISRLGESNIAFSPDNKMIALSAHNLNRGIFLLILEAETGNEVASVDHLEDWPSCLAFTPDGKSLVVGNKSGTIDIWPASLKERQRTYKGHQGEVTCLVASVGPGLVVRAASGVHAPVSW
jgi:WD40 repeat protein